ncbi:MAG: hypothetical protein UY92_C0008G0007 [Candidatus Magasanikbacteria bacterium GW2011_GWA2_56_11]|uniref:Uncharacterized protein n=1 Tax=Candidatus Magasanikbacteria bacterium GW2011_GWA2_56_11 TaxID=1619044 RepID=A0A0G1YGF7_9BACT|nr:MAG: hypothetical protein UY92_C0008G0007 [Candidatus Magasanikbacteria bacterium GW2011_GWA2_56_11]
MHRGALAAVLAALGTAAWPALVSSAPATGSNLVNVTACTQVGKDIRVRRGTGPERLLTSACRDAGHGLRDYTLTCVSPTQYLVSWKSCSSLPTTPDTNLPSGSITLVKSDKSGTGTILTLRVTGTDATSAIKKVIVSMQGGSFAVFTPIRTFTYTSSANQTVTETFTTPVLAAGQTFSFQAQVWDAAGNTALVNVFSFVVPSAADTIAPQISLFVTPTSTGSPAAQATAVVADESGFVDAIKLWWEQTAGVVSPLKFCAGGPSPRVCSVSLGSITTGSIFATASDKSGNVRTSAKQPASGSN